MIARTHGKAGDLLEFSGSAYDFGHSITAIQFSLNNGETWTTYETPGTNDYQNLNWKFQFSIEDPGFYVLRVRSVNDAGRVSPESAFSEIVIE